MLVPNILLIQSAFSFQEIARMNSLCLNPVILLSRRMGADKSTWIISGYNDSVQWETVHRKFYEPQILEFIQQRSLPCPIILQASSPAPGSSSSHRTSAHLSSRAEIASTGHFQVLFFFFNFS